jgi:hypothetical protein
MRASPERYGIRPGDSSTTEDEAPLEGTARGLGSPPIRHALAQRISQKISQMSGGSAFPCTAAQIFLTFELRRLVSRSLTHSSLAQSVEQAAVNRRVQGSSP